MDEYMYTLRGYWLRLWNFKIFLINEAIQNAIFHILVVALEFLYYTVKLT